METGLSGELRSYLVVSGGIDKAGDVVVQASQINSGTRCLAIINNNIIIVINIIINNNKCE